MTQRRAGSSELASAVSASPEKSSRRTSKGAAGDDASETASQGSSMPSITSEHSRAAQPHVCRRLGPNERDQQGRLVPFSQPQTNPGGGKDLPDKQRRGSQRSASTAGGSKRPSITSNLAQPGSKRPSVCSKISAQSNLSSPSRMCMGALHHQAKQAKVQQRRPSEISNDSKGSKNSYTCVGATHHIKKAESKKIKNERDAFAKENALDSIVEPQRQGTTTKAWSNVLQRREFADSPQPQQKPDKV